MELTMKNGFCELNEMEMQEVDGGTANPALPFFEKAAIVWIVYEIGYAFGKMFYHITH